MDEETSSRPSDDWDASMAGAAASAENKDEGNSLEELSLGLPFEVVIAVVVEHAISQHRESDAADNLPVIVKP